MVFFPIIGLGLGLGIALNFSLRVQFRVTGSIFMLPDSPEGSTKYYVSANSVQPIRTYGSANSVQPIRTYVSANNNGQF